MLQRVKVSLHNLNPVYQKSSVDRDLLTLMTNLVPLNLFPTTHQMGYIYSL